MCLFTVQDLLINKLVNRNAGNKITYQESLVFHYKTTNDENWTGKKNLSFGKTVHFITNWWSSKTTKQVNKSTVTSHDSRADEWPNKARIWFNFIKSEKTVMDEHTWIALQMHLDNKILDSQYFCIKMSCLHLFRSYTTFAPKPSVLTRTTETNCHAMPCHLQSTSLKKMSGFSSPDINHFSVKLQYRRFNVIFCAIHTKPVYTARSYLPLQAPCITIQSFTGP